MTPIQIIVLLLATWRITSLFVSESGPFFVFRKIRTLSGIAHDELGGVAMIPDTLFAQIVSCAWCCSVYVGAFWTLLYVLLPLIAPWLALPFALSAGAIFLHLLIEKSK